MSTWSGGKVSPCSTTGLLLPTPTPHEPTPHEAKPCPPSLAHDAAWAPGTHNDLGGGHREAIDGGNGNDDHTTQLHAVAASRGHVHQVSAQHLSREGVVFQVCGSAGTDSRVHWSAVKALVVHLAAASFSLAPPSLLHLRRHLVAAFPPNALT